MKSYKKILLALAQDDDTDNNIIKKAQELVAQYNADLTLIHAVEHMSNYGAAYGIAAGVDIEQELLKEAKKSMTKLGNQLNVDKEHQVVEVGLAKQLVIDLAEKIKADLIIVGSHGRHGVRLLLGSTANAVLHGAPCDVLAVRVQE